LEWLWPGAALHAKLLEIVYTSIAGRSLQGVHGVDDFFFRDLRLVVEFGQELKAVEIVQER
jgi:hypothetical protein